MVVYKYSWKSRTVLLAVDGWPRRSWPWRNVAVWGEITGGRRKITGGAASGCHAVDLDGVADEASHLCTVSDAP
jgi:hypothetical protein